MTRRTPLARAARTSIAVLATLSLGAAACSGDDDDPGNSPAESDIGGEGSDDGEGGLDGNEGGEGSDDGEGGLDGNEGGEGSDDG